MYYTDSEVCAHIIDIVKFHKYIIKKIITIDKVFNVPWGFVIYQNLSCMGYGMLIISNLDNLVDYVRYASAVLLFLIYFYNIFTRGQNIIDHSTAIADACFHCNWYGLSKRAMKLLLIIMMRSNKKCKLSAAGALELSCETFLLMFVKGVFYYLFIARQFYK
ncbi:odorant receptor 63a-like [Trichogramma pretiosum]|uniref:odorant receptor 63a-like n=1 Tax=Trichogramma pretiosum TaxID=7493 RepID=UPI000C71A1B9|nr:odorant receptor 63a-like [Trichogramma pretiosum]